MIVKYVVVSAHGREVPLLCPDEMGITHLDFAVAYWVRNEIVSAGYCDLASGRVWGESNALLKHARPAVDPELLRRYYLPIQDSAEMVGVFGSIKFKTVLRASLPPGCHGCMEGADGKMVLLMEATKQESET